MPQNIVQTNFTAGELAPEALARVDIAKYQNAAETLRNVIVQVLGGAKGRGGFRYVAAAKHADKKAKLVPFIFSREQAYMLLFGDGYMRVFKDGGQVEVSGLPYEITTPYTESMLSGLGYVQNTDTMFIARQQLPIHRIRRLDHDDWLLEPAPFEVTPFDEIGHRPAATLTLSAATVGIGRTATTSASAFLSSDIGRLIVSGGGVAKITAVASPTSATVDITTAFRATSAAANFWKIAGSPQATIAPSAKDPIGALITLDAKPTTVSEITKTITGLAHDGVTTVTVTVSAHGYSTGNTVIIAGCTPSAYNGTFIITVTGTNTFTYTLSPNPGAATIMGTVNRSINTTPDVWRAADVGSFVSINGGLVQITQIITPKQAKGEIVSVMTATVDAQPNAWILKSAVWNPVDGYPGAVSLYEQRLIAAGSPGYPDYVWMSRVGRALDFTLGTKDDDAFAVPIYSDQINPIVHIVQGKSLMALTYSGETAIVSGVERPLTYSTAQIKNQTNYGAAGVRPIRVGNQIFYIQRGSMTMRATSYQADTDGYVSPELSKLSRHLLSSPVVSMAHQQSPDSVVWIVLESGVALAVTVDSDESVIAWTQQTTEGAFEDIACIPTADGPDQVWAIVRREVDGDPVRYVELLDNAVHTDSALTGTSVSAISTWAGLGHLAGKTVQVLADGIPQPATTVSAGGEITLPRPANRIEAGLQFIPFVKLLTPEVVGPLGSVQGTNMRVSECTAILLNTVGCRVNEEYVEFRQFDTPILDQPAAPFTGQYRVPQLGWERGKASVVIQQDQPLPFHLLAVIRKFTSNG